MKSQEQREGDAVVIVTTTLWLGAVAVAVWVLFAVISAMTGLEGGPFIVVFWVTLGCAVVPPLAYLYRHRREPPRDRGHS
jgi:membrane protein YdbS with pleckstrin-like domain